MQPLLLQNALIPVVEPAPDGASDPELVARFLGNGDELAFRALYARHTPVLFRLALRLLPGRSTLAEDAVQEAWIRAAVRMRDFRFDSALRTWLAAILINCCREARRSKPQALDAPLPAFAAPGEGLDLERALAALADGYRQVLVLHDVMGYTHREIAAALDIEEGTAKSQLFRARRAMRRALAGRVQQEVRDG